MPIIIALKSNLIRYFRGININLDLNILIEKLIMNLNF
jgi:hypothetical protein